MKEEIESILVELREGVYEREEELGLVLLAMLAGENVFMLGPPGTAKSMIARKVATVFDQSRYFEQLLHRFSTPEELFGPVSIKSLKQDVYERQTAGYLPEAHFAFLDEIWKAGPSILNSLLMLMNERVFINNAKRIDAPLHSVVSASNELPNENDGLQALYDRFLVRIYIKPIESKDLFEKMLQTSVVTPTKSSLSIDAVQGYQEHIDRVSISEDTLNVIHHIRLNLGSIYVSDRRWRKAVRLLKASAYFSGRRTTNLNDTLLLRHCLWTTDENRQEVMKVVENAVKTNGFSAASDWSEKKSHLARLATEIKSDLYATQNIYDTKTIGGEPHLQVPTKLTDGEQYYLPEKSWIQHASGKLVDSGGDACRYTYDCSSGQIKIRYTTHYNRSEGAYTPKPKVKKGELKPVSPRVPEGLLKDVCDLQAYFEQEHQSLSHKKDIFDSESASPFVPDSISIFASDGTTQQLLSIADAVKECERLKELCSAALV